MRLEYKTRSIGEIMNEVVTPDVLTGAIKVLAIHLGVAEPSVEYLLQNGFSQSLQDSFAGPRAKAIKDGEPEATVNAVIDGCISKRLDAIKNGTIEAGKSQGRDPLKGVARDMLRDAAEKQGKTISKENVEKLLPDFMVKYDAEIKAEVAKRKAAKASEVSLEDLAL